MNKIFQEEQDTDKEALLTDAQMRRFVTDGYLVLNANVDAEVHQVIYDRLQ